MKKEIISLTSMRFFAAFFVFVFHARGLLPVPIDETTLFFSRGYLWVDFFFVLSGFVLSYNYFNQYYGGTFNSLKNGEMQAMCGIGDWITGVLEKDGAPVGSVVPKEGGIQWTESYCIGKGSEKADIVKEFIQYMLSPAGQVKSAKMAAYPGFAITKSGRAKLIDADRKEAERTGQIDGMANDPITLVKEGRIHYRNIPVQQSLEDWNDFWSEYKNA